MKKIIFFLFILQILILNAQSRKQVSQLVDLCNVWGNLKYFHPEIATGKHNWDSIAITSISKILNAKSNNIFGNEVDKMFEIAGTNNAQEFVIDKSRHYYTYRNINHSWIEKSKNLTTRQKEVLKFNYSHPFQGINYYAQPNPNDEGNIITPNEKPYDEMKMPNTEYRLLGLFRFWNVINYFYPYKYATDKPWEKVIGELIPEFIKAKDIVSYHKAVLKMSASIDDGHGGVFPFIKESVAGKFSPPFYFQLVNNKAVVTKIIGENQYKDSTIVVGSVIEKIDGISVKKRLKEFWNYVPASNDGGKYRDLHSMVLNSKNSTAFLSGYNPKGKKFEVSVKLREANFLKEFLDFYEMTSPITSKMIDNDIAYIFASNITKKNIDSVMLPLMKTKAIILDLRNYPNTLPSYKMADYFLSEPSFYSKQTRNDFRYPGLFIYENTNAGSSVEMVGKTNSNSYKGKLILLVDYRTQSLPEFICLILKSYKNTFVVGSQTSGTDGNVTRMIFPGGYKIMFSGYGIYDVNGNETQRVGIPIDIPIKIKIENVQKKQDITLNKAIDFAKYGK